ncbi:MAG: SLC13 family permease [Acidobacteria bacterium]|nr:SLC13 family permease [Acidobacteriota bacterium]
MTLGPDAWITLGATALIFIALIRELASPDLVFVAALLLLMITGVLTPSEALVGFSNPAVLAIAALFVVAAAVIRSGALSFLYPVMAPRPNATPARSVAGLIIPAAAISAFTNNTPLVAILTPLVRQWGLKAGISPSRLLMPMAFATTIGGTMTLIGTSTNLLVSALLAADGHGLLGLWEMSAVGVPIAIVGVLYLIFVAPRILPDRIEVATDEDRSARAFQFELAIPEGSPLDGRSIEEAALRNLQGAFVAHIYRDGELIGPVRPDQRLQTGDRVAFVGDPSIMADLLGRGDLVRPIETPSTTPSEELPLFHAVVAAHSTLVGRTLRDVDFRNNYEAVVLGIHRSGQRVTKPLGRTRLEPGDLLLVEGHGAFETATANSGDFYLVSPVRRKEMVEKKKAPVVLAIVALMVTAVSFGWVDLVTASLAAALGVIGFRVITPVDARKNVNLPVVIMVAAGIGLGQAFAKTGLANLVANQVIDLTRPIGAIGVLAAIYILTNLLTELLTNQASAVIVFPIAIATAVEIGANPHAFAIAVAIAASAGFATPIGYQTHLMVMNAGGYRFTDYTRTGLPLNFIVAAVAIPMIAWIWL